MLGLGCAQQKGGPRRTGRLTVLIPPGRSEVWVALRWGWEVTVTQEWPEGARRSSGNPLSLHAHLNWTLCPRCVARGLMPTQLDQGPSSRKKTHFNDVGPRGWEGAGGGSWSCSRSMSCPRGIYVVGSPCRNPRMREPSRLYEICPWRFTKKHKDFCGAQHNGILTQPLHCCGA